MAKSSGREFGSSGSGGGDELREPLEQLRAELRELGDRIGNLPASGAKAENQGIERHLRRFMPFYALATVWVLMLVLFPTVNRSGGTDELTGVGVQGGAGSQSLESDSFDDYTSGEFGEAEAVEGATNTGSATVGRTSRSSGRAVNRTEAGTRALITSGVEVGSGVTRGGFECKPGVRQLPWSAYATQCVAKFSGSNGGATARGVLADKIIIADRKFPESANSQATAAFAEAAGSASSDVHAETEQIFFDYFSQVFETYGRKITYVEFEASSQSNSTEEAQSRGKEGACIDATKVASEIKAFAEDGGSGPFGECLAERKVIGLSHGAYFPESWYRKFHPYLWNGVMGCERISYQVAEYIGKRLAGRKAKWAGDPLFQQQERTFGVYVPNNDEYQHCVDIYESEVKRQYGVQNKSRYNYTLDVSRFPDEAARGVVQFKAAGVTTLVNACDPYSTLFLTQAATSQNYFPEWHIIGVAAQDVDSVARLFDQQQVDGHLFGMSQLGDQSKLWGPKGEPGMTYKRITGKDIPPGTTGNYFGLVRLFNFIQAAGPNLTTETFEKGAHATMFGGPPEYAVGYVSYADGPDGTKGGTDHTGIDDSREIYWCGSCKSRLDGKDGTYLETYNAKRFRNNEWPAEEPPVYPAGYREANGG